MNRLLNFIKKELSGTNSVEEDKKFPIGLLILWIGTKCTLRCRDCWNLIPYSKQESFDIDSTIQDVKKLLSCCKIEKLQIQGGEPFTHPHIDKLIKVIDDFDIPEVLITTNGTVSLQQNIVKLLKNVKHQNFYIVISPYKAVKNKQIAFYHTLVSNNIKCNMYNYYLDDGLWVSQEGFERHREEDDQRVQDIYLACDFKVCPGLVDGKLYRCGFAKVSTEVFDISLTPSDFVDIRKIKNTTEGISEISKYFNNPNFKEYCRYCLGTQGNKAVPGIQLHNKPKMILAQ